MNSPVNSNLLGLESTDNKTVAQHKIHQGYDIKNLLPLLERSQDINFWRDLSPDSTICDRPFDGSQLPGQAIEARQLGKYQLQLQEERYFQTEFGLPSSATREMYACIDRVKKAGFHPGFALVYDVFYRSLFYFDPVLTAMLGSGYKLFPSMWVYDVDPTDTSQGFKEHRDGEYTNTIDANGMPMVLTLWIAVTEANLLNSCIYVVPANRDLTYKQSISNPEVKPTFNLQDIRALPTSAGTLTCWDQYIFHWGSRSSKRAKSGRISYACYCQRGDVPSFGGSLIDVPSELDFEARLVTIYKTLLRYCYSPVRSQSSKELQQLLESMKHYIQTHENISNQAL